jgi:hypothetical protein
VLLSYQIAVGYVRTRARQIGVHEVTAGATALNFLQLCGTAGLVETP